MDTADGVRASPQASSVSGRTIMGIKATSEILSGGRLACSQPSPRTAAACEPPMVSRA